MINKVLQTVSPLYSNNSPRVSFFPFFFPPAGTYMLLHGIWLYFNSYREKAFQLQNIYKSVVTTLLNKNSFIHSFDKNSLNSFHMPGTIPNPLRTNINKAYMLSAFLKLKNQCYYFNLKNIMTFCHFHASQMYLILINKILQ